MKNTFPARGRQAPAFTLIEIITVMAIILVLMGMVVGGFGWYQRKASEGRTTVLVHSIGRALEEYKLDNGSFPPGDGAEGSSKEVYIALYGDGDGDGKPDDGAQVYLNVLDPGLVGKQKNVYSEGGSYVIKDAWKKDIFYRSPGFMNPPSSFDLWSLGPDGEGGPETGTEQERTDDIKNW